MKLNRMTCVFAGVALGSMVLASVATADTLELADGTILEGDLVGNSNNIVMFDSGNGIEAYPESEVVGIYLSAGVETREAMQQEAPSSVTVASGTRMVIRTTEAIDTRQHPPGHRFRGQLEGALVVDGVTAVPNGAYVYGQVVEAKKSGRLAGKAELTIVFTDLMINEQLYPISSALLGATGGNEAGKTVGRTARAAAIGGLVSGSSGAKTGAKVGVGASIITSGSSLSVPAGSLIETELTEPLTIAL